MRACVGACGCVCGFLGVRGGVHAAWGVRAAGAACFDGAPSIGLRDAAASGGWGRAKRAPSGVRTRMRRLRSGGLGCPSCALGEFSTFAAASMPPKASVLRVLRALVMRRGLGCVMPPRPRGGRSVAVGPHRRRRPAGLGLSGPGDEVTVLGDRSAAAKTARVPGGILPPRSSRDVRGCGGCACGCSRCLVRARWMLDLHGGILPRRDPPDQARRIHSGAAVRERVCGRRPLRSATNSRTRLAPTCPRAARRSRAGGASGTGSTCPGRARGAGPS